VARYAAELMTIEPGMAARELFAAEQQQSGRVVYSALQLTRTLLLGKALPPWSVMQSVASLDILLAPLGGGGLLSGSAIAARALGVACVIGVEPELAADGLASLQQGSIQPAMPPLSICDGLLTSLGTQTFPLLQQFVDRVLLVSDDEALAAQQLCYQTLGEWIEPSSATVIAAIGRYPEHFNGLRVGAIISGGNVAPPR